MNDAHFQRGSLLYHQGRYADAIGELQLQLAAGETFLTHGLLALCFAQLQKFAEATEHAQRAIHLAPDEAFGHYTLAQVFLLRNRFAEAQAAIEEAIRLSPYDADYFAILGSVHMRSSRWRDALAAANQGLQIDPEHAVLINLRAQALVKLGDREAAAATIGEALARRPDDPYTHANQGWALLHQGDPYKALEHFREALRLNPELEWARQGIVEALKARNIVYRLMLGYFLWMARLQPQVRWMLVFGALFAIQIVERMAKTLPALWIVFYAYVAFVLMSWLAYPIFNLLLRFDRFGRYALSADQRRGANLLACCLATAVGFLGWGAFAGNELAIVAGLFFALLSLPASAIFVCDAGWPRQAMIGISLALVVLILVIVAAALVPPARLPLSAQAALVEYIRLLGYGILVSQLAANYLMATTPKR